ncbi:mannitol dehydrogenase family protein [Saccharospirillum salsuginis]|uniref:Mannitol 2-dehydrogenase n=1 Tax=Saccharospirillum salsuginis TaxID=418750 RepID=A0A918NER3_9GAMM|nr:mannitol dehydrogenase family protein [Saccharospirillum salsuginis]GGX67500.1 mannitol 2-dehydrogenase [Saccharospirillum salsuginis]
MTHVPRPLTELTSRACPPGIQWPAYERAQVRIGIAHIGVGGFHRAHQTRYLDDYMASTDDLNWGVCGIGLMPGDESLIRQLKQQDGLYTLTEKDDHGSRSRVIGSIKRLLFAPDERDAVIGQLADPEVRIISMTVTEGGYRYDFEKDRFFSDHPDIVHDLEHPESPRTLFGFLWQAGRRRARLADDGRVTLLSCDNVPQNGDVLRKAMLAFIELAEPELKPWFEQAVTYPNSMVDRITPAPSSADTDLVRNEFEVVDPCAVGCETFIQWVVEDHFAAGRPALEQVRVQFTSDVSPYEKTKLRLLNGSHLMMAYVGYLAGYKRVDAAIKDIAIRQLVRDYMVLDAEPTLPTIPDMPVKPYQATLIERFGNSRIGDQQIRICSDGYAKLKNYSMPVVTDLLSRQADTTRLSFMFACFLAYLNATSDDGTELEIMEFNLPDELNRATRSDRLSLLKTDAFFGEHPDPAGQAFLKEVDHWYRTIVDRGAYDTLVDCLKQSA